MLAQGGQTGTLFSRNLRDLEKMWGDVEYIPMQVSGYEVDQTLTLAPK